MNKDSVNSGIEHPSNERLLSPRPALASGLVFEFEGVQVKVATGGVWKCPFRCGDSRFPARKWKTEAGIRRHLSECPQSPSKIAERHAQREVDQQINEQKKQDALSGCQVRVGDTIFYVHEITVRPTHEERFGRMVRVRYEPVMRFEAREATIKTIDFNGSLIFNGHIRMSAVCATREEAKERATAMQKADDDHREFAASVR